MFNPSRHLLALGLATVVAVPAVASAQSSELDKLQIHGYLTQGYGESTKLPFAGLPTDATGDYRTAALQFRYSITDNDNVIVQLRHRRMGTSAIAAGESDVQLNWAFYQRKLGPVRVKAGKLPIPMGLYNEIRSVGTVLPFYRAPYNFYAEGYETIDGASAAGSFSLGRAGSVEAGVYGGGLNVKIPFSLPNGTSTIVNARLEAIRGAQVWYNTPISGLRVGASGMRFRSRKATDTSTTPTSSQWIGSVEGSWDRVQLRSEYTNVTAGTAHLLSYYGQAGVRVVGGLSLNAQNDISDISARVAPTVLLRQRNMRDFAVGANYQFSPTLVVKLVQHDAKGYGFDTPVAATRAPGQSKYFVASVSTAF
jgi:hypothetical protein